MAGKITLGSSGSTSRHPTERSSPAARATSRRRRRRKASSRCRPTRPVPRWWTKPGSAVNCRLTRRSWSSLLWCWTAAAKARWHEKWLTAHPAATLAQLQTLLDEFTDYYNRVRPHRAHRHSDPDPGLQRPTQGHRDRYLIPAHCRVRTDVIDAAGVITIRYNSHLHHIGLSKRRRGTKVTVLIDDRDIRVLDRHTGQLIRKLVLDPTRDYQPRGVKCGNSPENRQ